jgi:hypothetical protein
MALVYGGAIMLRARGLIRQRNVRGQSSTLTEGDWGYANFRELLFYVVHEYGKKAEAANSPDPLLN